MRLDTDKIGGLNLLSTSVLIVDVNGMIEYVNAACESLLGRSNKILFGFPVSSFLPKAREWIGSYKKNTSSLFSVRAELTELILRPGALVQVYASVHPLPEEEQLLIIELQPAKNSLLLNHNKHMNDLSENTRRLLRNLAHEIKNPLGGIRGAAQLLEFDLKDEEQKEYTRVVISEADRLQGLVDKLLAPYRQPYKPSKTNIHEILEKARLLIESEFSSGLTIVRDYDISVPDIDGDRGQLTQIFLNLLRNAVEALEEQIRENTARLTISTRVVHHVMIGALRHKTALNIHIVDNGPGIPPELQESIFFPLVTGKAGGTGLGLSLVHSFVEQHGGSIEVYSRKGKTDFSLLFPLEL